MASESIGDRELRLECLKLAVLNSGTTGIRDPIARAEEFLAWCNPPDKPATKAPARKATKK